MMPHLAESCWEALGHKPLRRRDALAEGRSGAGWRPTRVTIAVQVNGKLRGTIAVAARTGQGMTVEAAALALERVQRALDGKTPRKVIVVPEPHREHRRMRRARALAVFGLRSARRAAAFIRFMPCPTRRSGSMQQHLGSIYVEPVPERLGYELRNQLIDLLDARRRAGRRSLSPAPDAVGKERRHRRAEPAASGGITQTAITRYNDTLTVDYELVDAQDQRGRDARDRDRACRPTTCWPRLMPRWRCSRMPTARRRGHRRPHPHRSGGLFRAERALRNDRQIVRGRPHCAKNPPRGLVAALVFGPDAGLVRERSETLLKTVVDDLADPFRVADLDEQTLANDPARLVDEAAAISMLGGRRVVRVRGAGNASGQTVRSFPRRTHGRRAGGGGGGRSRQGLGAAQACSKRPTTPPPFPAMPIRARDLAEVVRDALRAEGLSIAPDALADAVSRLGSDRGVTRRELEKLALYARGQKQVDARRRARRDGRRSRSAGGGSLRCGGLRRSRPPGSGAGAAVDGRHVSPVAVLRQAMAHFQRLLLVGAEAARGESARRRDAQAAPAGAFFARRLLQGPGAEMERSQARRRARPAAGSRSLVQDHRRSRRSGLRPRAVQRGGDGEGNGARC